MSSANANQFDFFSVRAKNFAQWKTGFTNHIV
jgi:hypothetical protein